MEKKKNPRSDLEKSRNLYFFVGLSAAITLAITAFEWRSIQGPKVDLNASNIDLMDEIIIQRTVIKPPSPPKPKIINPVIEEVSEEEEIEDIEIVIDNDLFEDPDLDWAPVEEIPEEKIEVYDGIVEVMPVPIGGYDAFYTYLGKQIKYPNQARIVGTEGKVFVQFVISDQGEITDIQVIKGIGSGCDEEAIRVLRLAPKWNPGKQRGQAVNVRMVIPIIFKLSQ